jgi:hypothetical protein
MRGITFAMPNRFFRGKPVRKILLSTLAVSFSSTAIGAQPITLRPSTPWNLEYAKDSCLLGRAFGPSDSQVVLRFELVSPKSDISTTLAGPGLKSASVRANNILRVDQLDDVELDGGWLAKASGTNITAFQWSGGIEVGDFGLVSSDTAKRIRDAKSDRLGKDDHVWPRPSEAEKRQNDVAFRMRADKVQSLTLNPGRKGGFTLLTGPLGAAFSALSKCAEDSLQYFGIDPAIQNSIRIPAHLRSNSQHLVSEDYPESALRKGQQSQLRVWLNLDEKGAIMTCRVRSIFDATDINERICPILRRKWKFEPARRADGVAVPDYYTQSINFIVE